MEEIAKTLNLPLFKGLYKNGEYKQSDQRFSDRNKIKDIIEVTGLELIKERKVLLIDDVVTSGNSIMACIECLEKGAPSKIELLILAKNIKENI